jgi:hypothetical protein
MWFCGGAPPPPPPPAPRPALPWAIAAFAAVVAAVALWGWLGAPKPAAPAAVRFFVHPPDKAGFLAGAVAVSPDGRHLVSAVGEAGKRQLWVRSLDTLAARPLSGTEEGRYPFWSPDSRYIGFIAGGKLK